MKIKLKKMLLTSSLLASSTALSIVAISADTDSNANTNNNGTGGGTTPKTPATPPKNADDFDSFKGELDKKVKENVEKLVDDTVTALNNKAKELIEATKSEPNIARDLIVKALYYQKVATYLQTNKAKLVSDKTFDPTYLNALANDKKYSLGNITYEGKEFSNVIIGSNPNDYASALAKDSNSKKEVTEKDKVNDISKDDLNSKINDYFKNITDNENENAGDNIFVNKDDLPKLNTNTELTFDKTFDLTTPKNYSSWDDYIKEKLQKRFTIYDISQNQDQNQEQKKQQDNTQQNQNPIPGLPKENEEDLNKNIASQNVPRIAPFINYKYSGFTDYNDILARTGNSAQLFSFDNPINPRFEYRVTEISNFNLDPGYSEFIKQNPTFFDDRGNFPIKVKVEIRDLNDPTKTATYAVGYVKNYGNSTLAREIANQIVQDTYSKFYTALGMKPDQLNFTNVGNAEIAAAAFDLMGVTTGIINEPKYNASYIDLLVRLGSSVKLEENEDLKTAAKRYENTPFGKAVQTLFLSAIKTSNLNNSAYWTFFSTRLESVFAQLSFNINNSNSGSTNRDKIREFFAKNPNYSVETFDKAMQSLNSRIQYFKGLAGNPTFDESAQYNTMMEQLTIIMEQIRNMTTILTDVLQSQAPSDQKKFQAAYEKLNILPIESGQNNKIVLASIGSILMLISIGLFILSIFLQNFKRRKWLSNKTNKIALTWSITSVTFIIAIALIVFAILGGI